MPSDPHHRMTPPTSEWLERPPFSTEGAGRVGASWVKNDPFARGHVLGELEQNEGGLAGRPDEAPGGKDLSPDAYEASCVTSLERRTDGG